MTLLQEVAAALFGLALVHTFSVKLFEKWAHRYPRHAGIFHLLGEVEVVFGFWALVLVVAMAAIVDGHAAIEYVESKQYTEPLFVFVVMVVAASRPVLYWVEAAIQTVARILPLPTLPMQIWLSLAVVPLLGSLITEPAAMTLAALMLFRPVFNAPMPEYMKYAALGSLFVNVSIGGTLTSYAAPPVLMVAEAWHWNSAFMFGEFGWKAAVAVAINASMITLLLSRHLSASPADTGQVQRVPVVAGLVHAVFLAGVVMFAHHPVIFISLFLFFLGYTQAYAQYQSPLILKEGLLVGFFLAGLVILGGMQQWWLQPVVSGLQPVALFFGTTALTAITDNAALTYLGSLISGMSDPAKYMLVAGAVTGGGLTVIANAPNPAGVALLRQGFEDESIGAMGLLLGALPPTLIAAACFLLLD
ncbi:MAG: putative Na+/H+ antiporter [Sulfuriferula sp.]|nr:putative Na+/H+ antiporter [Sulfuriferula sp.]